MKSKKLLNFKVIITQDEDSLFVAECPAIPGCHSQGKTYEEAEKNIKKAIELCLQVAEEDQEYKEGIDYEVNSSPRMVSISNITVPSPHSL